MSAVEHDNAQLGAYVLGALGETEVREFEAHLLSCALCRTEVDELSDMKNFLDEVPPEAFLDGPPEGGDLLLQRTLRRVRAEERPAAPGRPRLLALAGAAVLVVVALGGGVLVGRGTAPSSGQANGPVTSAPAPVAGVRNVSADNAATGAKLIATVTPAVGWVKVHAKIDGVKEGEKCQLIVTTKQGEKVVAGSWLVSAKGQWQGTGLDGSALVAPDQVASVDVVTMDGRKLVSAPV